MTPADPTDDKAFGYPNNSDCLSASELQALRHREAFLQDFLETASIGIHRAAADGTILWANQAECDLVGYGPEEYIGRNIAGFHADQDVMQDIQARLARGEVLRDYPARLRHRDGSIRHVLINASAFFENEEFVYTRCFTRDVTTLRQEYEASLLLAAIVDSSDDAIISKDLTGRIMSWNGGAERIFGYTAEEAVGQSVMMLIPEDRQDEEAQILSLLQRGLRVNHFETVRRRKDGTLLDISLTISPVRDRNGRIIGASKIARSIGERRRAEQLRAQLSAIVESSGDAIYIYDFEGKILTWNRAAEELYGYSEREMVGRHISTILSGDLKEDVPNFRNGRGIRKLESQRVRRDGTVFPVLLTISPVRGEGDEVVGVSVIERDISDQKRSEESLREGKKLESLGLLAGGIAHEFNNLLTGVLGNASLLGSDLLSGSREWDMAQSIVESAERMARLTSQMLAYSGRGHFVIERVDLSGQIEGMSNLIQASMPKEVELRMSLGEDLPLIEVDVSQLQQVVLNLLINAAESTAGRGIVQVKTSVATVGEQELRANMARTEPLPGNYAVLTVEDNGCGMDETTRARVFDPFFTTKFMGRGLGLSSVLGIVRGHKGIITVESTLGAGTTVRVYFPVVETAPAPRAAKKEITVLVVDDEDVVRQTAGRALRGLGFQVITATNGVEALQVYAAKADRIDIVLLDTMMPVMGGEETLRALHETWPEATVLVMSGYQESEVKERFGGGTAGFVQKPFTAGQLAIKVLGALRSKTG